MDCRGVCKISEFKEQDVNIKIISGDNPKTVSNLLRQLEIEDYDKYVEIANSKETAIAKPAETITSAELKSELKRRK